MKLLMLRSVWSGSSNLEQLIQQTIADGFDGIEGPIPRDSYHRRELCKQLAEHQLVYIAEATTGINPEATGDWWIPHRDRTLQDHLKDLRWTVEHAAEMRALFVSTMCGYDAWSWQQNLDFFGQALALEQAVGIAIGFETHRSRSLFNPWVTRDLLLEFPTMKLTCDFSHWCVVCERLIDTEWEILELCAQRALHIQCRVGYAQHAQVPDPRAPEYRLALDAHERWWDCLNSCTMGICRPYPTLKCQLPISGISPAGLPIDNVNALRSTINPLIPSLISPGGKSLRNPL
jgi:sugar phosphate isomerase/epimerase